MPPNVRQVTVAMVLLAGGSGSRLGGRGNKAYLEVGGCPLIEHSLETFARCETVERLVLVIREADRELAEAAASRAGGGKVTAVVEGGPSRTASEAAGLSTLAGAVGGGEVGLIGIHDAARPFASLDLLERLLAAADAGHGAVPALPPSEQVLIRQGKALQWIDQSRLVRVQTPQLFPAAPLLAAFARAATDPQPAFDTAEIVERHSSMEIRLVPGDPDNVKVTFEEDLVVAARLAERFRGGRWKG